MNKVEYSNNKIQYQLDKLEFHVNKIGIDNVDENLREQLIDILKVDEVVTESELTIISPDVPSEETAKSFEIESDTKTNNDDKGLHREVVEDSEEELKGNDENNENTFSDWKF